MRSFLRARCLLAALLSLAIHLQSGAAERGTAQVLDLASYRGKVVLVDFWASWCAPCKESFAWMQQMHNRYVDQGLVIVAVNLDHDRKAAIDFINNLQPSFAVHFDTQADLAERFHVAAMPTSFYLDRTGKIRFTHAGFRIKERADAERELRLLLGEEHQAVVPAQRDPSGAGM